MYELERLAQGVFFEVLDQLGDSVGVDPCLGAVVAGPQSPEGVVCLIDKGAVEFQRISLSPASKHPVREALDGFVDYPFPAGAVGTIVDCGRGSRGL